jgi:hypothetical protein
MSTDAIRIRFMIASFPGRGFALSPLPQEDATRPYRNTVLIYMTHG